MASFDSEPIRFWFDFASPYAYYAVPGITALAARHGRQIEWRPLLLWAVLKEHGIAAPLDTPSRKDYLFADIDRSADFFGLPLAKPAKIPFSSHLAGRLFYGLTAEAPDLATNYVKALLERVFAQGGDITSLSALQEVICSLGFDPTGTQALIAAGRDALASAVSEAVAYGVIGSPFIIVDGESFFGADRLPQIAWRLAGSPPNGEKV
jgi:2-hydroxychromene-2-carboxylate isomerase